MSSFVRKVASRVGWYRTPSLLLALTAIAWSAPQATFTLPLKGDGETLVAAAPSARSFQCDDPALLAWITTTVLPRLLADWIDIEPETVMDADGILKTGLPEVTPLPTGFVSVTSALDSANSGSDRAVFKLTFTPRNDRAELDLVIECSWVPPGAAWRVTLGELRELVLASPPGERLALSEDDLERASRLSAMSAYFVHVAGAEAEIVATAPSAPIPPRLAVAAIATAAEIERQDLLATWSAAGRLPARALNGLRSALQRQFGTAVHQPLTPRFELKPETLNATAFRLKLLKFDPITRQFVRLGLWVGHDGDTVPEERLQQLRARGWQTDTLQQHFSRIETDYSSALEREETYRLVPPAYITEAEAVARAGFVGKLNRVRPPAPFIVETLASAPDAASASDPESASASATPARERALVFAVTYQPRLDEAVADLKITPEEGIVGGASFSSRNLTAGLDDAFYVGFDAGENLQDATLSYNTATRKTARDHLWQVNGTAGWTRDDEQRFGQATTYASGEKTDVNVDLDFWIHDRAMPATGTTPGLRRWLKVTPNVGWTRQSLTAAEPLFIRDPNYRGLRAGLSLDAGWREDRPAPKHSGVHASRRSARLKVETLHTWREAGPDFTIARIRSEAQWQFGPGGERRHYLGFALQAGTASRETPIGAQWRLGGEEWLRGLEEGELIGRHVQAARLEAGVDPFALLGGTRAAASNSANASAASASTTVAPEKKAPTIADTPILLVGSIESGRVSGQESLIANAAPSTASSFGLGLQFLSAGSGKSPMPFELNLGYAWSPQGQRENGRVYASVQFLFPIRNSTQPP